MRVKIYKFTSTVPKFLEIVYMDDAFHYHFWTCYFIGKWILIDPTLRPWNLDARLITLMETSLNDMSLIDLGIEISRYLQIKKITVMHVENGQEQRR